MSALVADTSAFIAVLNGERDRERIAAAFVRARAVLASTATLHELNCVILRAQLQEGIARKERLLSLLDCRMVPFDETQLAIAMRAYADFGRGSGHRAGLNMGDCFSYALARAHDLPLFYKGDDFLHTDIRSVLGET